MCCVRRVWRRHQLLQEGLDRAYKGVNLAAESLDGPTPTAWHCAGLDSSITLMREPGGPPTALVLFTGKNPVHTEHT